MIGNTLAHYEILEKIGAGGMGEIYRARDTRLKREVAIKVLPHDVAADPARLERFQREAETLAGLSHPHIVHLYSLEEADGVRFLTMELVDGKGLDQLLTPDASLCRSSSRSASPWPTRSRRPPRRGSPTATSSRPT